MEEAFMSDEILSRRDFFKRAAALGLGAAAVGASLSLLGCNKKGGNGEEGEAAPCSDLSGVPESQQQMRQQLQYTYPSPEEGKHCANCQLFTAPEGDATCGTCQLNIGPVHPDGYCTSWAERQG